MSGCTGAHRRRPRTRPQHWLRPSTAATVLLFLLMAGPGIARAGCGTAPDLDQAIEDATSVFVGRVVTTSDHDRIAEVQVLSVWKGPDLPEHVDLYGIAEPGAPTGPDDGRFRAGQTYLVIPENTRRPFLATSCSATRSFTASGTSIPVGYQDEAGATVGRRPIVEAGGMGNADSALSGPVVLAGAAVAAAAAVALVRLPQGKQEKREPMVVRPHEPERKKARYRLKVHHFSLAGIGARLLTRSGMRRVDRNKRDH